MKMRDQLQQGNIEGEGSQCGQMESVSVSANVSDDKLIDLTGPETPPENAPLIKVGNDLVFMLDGRMVTMDQLLPSSSKKLEQVTR
jgi:hypothetical protein